MTRRVAGVDRLGLNTGARRDVVDRISGPVMLAWSAVGYLFAAWLYLQVIGLGRLGFDLRTFFLPAGHALLTGGDVYAPRIVPGAGPLDGFFWAPPWAVIYAAVSWLPWQAVYIATFVAEVGALRVMCGSWRRVGYAAWFPLIPFELVSGNINLLIAAAIVSAQRGKAGPLAWAALAKLAPAFALPPRDWRPFALMLVAAVALTLPWPSLWPEWIATLLRALEHGGVGPMVPVPFGLRLALAVPLIALQRPWSRVLAGVLAVPGFYWQSLVLLLAPLMVWARRNETTRSPGGFGGGRSALTGRPDS